MHKIFPRGLSPDTTSETALSEVKRIECPAIDVTNNFEQTVQQREADFLLLYVILYVGKRNRAQ